MDTFNLRSLMKIRGIGNKELSEKSGIPLGTLNKIIYGNTKSPTLDNMIALAEALHCTLDDFTDSSLVRKQMPHVEHSARIDQLFLQLNEEGQERLINYAEDLVASGRYIKNDPDQLVDPDAC